MPDPVVTITNGVPVSGTGTITTLGQTLVDGANATMGANGDAVSLTGSMSSKLRAIATALGTTALDLGAGTAGSRTIRTILDSSQLAPLNTTPQTMSTGFQLIDTPTDGVGAGRIGSLTETAPASDTASSGLNGRLQRVAQRLTSMIGQLPAALGTSGGLKADDIFSQYKTAPASATTKMGATGAVGDYLAGVLIVPGTAAAGVVQIQDGNGTAITVFAGGGTTALADLKPFMVPLGIYALAATTPGWNIITNTNVTAVGIGKFT